MPFGDALPLLQLADLSVACRQTQRASGPDLVSASTPHFLSPYPSLPAGGMRWDLPRDMSHMLRAGLLPALERLVREGPAEVAARGEAEQSVAEVVLAEWAICRESVCRGGRAASDWDRLMAYTEPRQLAGLVSAIADVLRRGATAAEPNG